MSRVSGIEPKWWLRDKLQTCNKGKSSFHDYHSLMSNRLARTVNLNISPVESERKIRKVRKVRKVRKKE